MQWARALAVEQGFVEGPHVHGHGVWGLTEKGRTSAESLRDSGMVLDSDGVGQPLTGTSPEDDARRRQRQAEIGDKGERFVVNHERERLHRAGRADLAERVDHVSLRVVDAGYDVVSYDEAGVQVFFSIEATQYRVTRHEVAPDG